MVGLHFPPTLPDPSEVPIEPNPFRFPKVLPMYRGQTNGPLPTLDPSAAAGELCSTKLVMASVTGYGLGAVFGLVFGSFDHASNIPLPGARELPKVPFAEQVRLQYRGTLRKCHSMGKNFLVFTALISGMECVIEKYRARHDVKNAALAGCMTGGALAASQGPMASCLGCAGFAAFSVAMDKMLDLH